MNTSPDMQVAETRASERRLRRIGLPVCALLAILFTINAWMAVSNKSITFDETVHAPAAYTHLRYNDFRMNSEHPPLWKYWAALPWLLDPPGDLRLEDPDFVTAPNGWSWAPNVLYHTPANDGKHLVAMSRLFMLLLGTGLLALIARFAWRAGGPVAAMIATALFAFDPNFLAHAPLVTNDVSFALITLAMVDCLWRCTQALTKRRVAVLALLCAAAVTTKFTALWLGPVVVSVLLIRATSPQPWRRGREIDSIASTTEGRVIDPGILRSRFARLGAVLVVCLVCGLVSYVVLWAAYGFRFNATSDPSLRANFDAQIEQALGNRIAMRTGITPRPEQIAAEPAGLAVHTLCFLHDRALLPESFLTGVVFVYANSFNRMTFLLGSISGGAHPFYFPVAILVKTPLAALALIGFAAAAFGFVRKSRENDRWLWTCLLVPFALLFTIAILSPLNIGQRHILHLYPLGYVFVGVVLARVIERQRPVLGIIFGLIVLLMLETITTFPNYLSYFNIAAGGARGGERILGDSNLDWGQDLPALARWQQAHPDRQLYLAYFGTADPAYYGVRYEPLTLGTDFKRIRPTFPDSGVVAASVTMLQVNWRREDAAAFFKMLREREPDAVLGGSIYLFDLGE